MRGPPPRFRRTGRDQRRTLLFLQNPPFPLGQGAEFKWADPLALELDHPDADQVAHAPDLPVAALTQDNTQRLLAQAFDDGAFQAPAIEAQSMAQLVQRRLTHTAAHANDVFLVHVRIRANHGFGHNPVFRQDEEPMAVLVKAADGGQLVAPTGYDVTGAM